MTRGAKGCLLVTGAMLFVLVLVAAAVLLSGGIPRDTVLDLKIAGEIVEEHEDSLPSRFLQGKVTQLRDLTRAIDRASRDEHVNGIMAVIKPFSMGMGKIQEIRDAVSRFRKTGKWAHVYLDSAGEGTSGNGIYYLASAFDEIWMSPAGDLNLYGLLSVTPFLRGLFDKLGVYPDLDSIGKYKNAKDLYTEKRMTEAHREATTTYLKDWYEQIVSGIAEARGMDKDQVDRLIKDGPYTAEEALEKGLVNHLGYEDEYESAIRELNGGDLSLLAAGKYLEKRKSPSGARIAVITGRGLIITGKSAADSFAGAEMGSETMVDAFRKVQENRGIKAVIFRVDSPGGSALASDLIWRAVHKTAQGKPVIISMSDVAASGGYYVSMGATKIVSQPGTVTGSIGVVAGKLVTAGFYDLLGLHREAIKIGDHATYFYTGQKYTDAEREIYWKFMHKVYDTFTRRVADGRGMTVEQVDDVGRGHVWTGTRAKKLGLVDELGGMHRAIELAKQEADIPEQEDVRLVYLPERRSWVQRLLWPEQTATGPAAIPGEWADVLRDFSRIMILQKEGVWLLADPVASVP